MNRDSITATLLVVLTLLAYLDPVVLFLAVPLGVYGGWRIGERVIRPRMETAEA